MIRRSVKKLFKRALRHPRLKPFFSDMQTIWREARAEQAQSLTEVMAMADVPEITPIALRTSTVDAAPRLNLLGQRDAVSVDTPPAAAPSTLALQTQWMQAVRHMLENTEDVGPAFPEQARRIHYGETEARGIRGQATPNERRALLDEGIEIMSLPMPAALKGPVQ